jgi:hypothetical protein
MMAQPDASGSAGVQHHSFGLPDHRFIAPSLFEDRHGRHDLASS